MPFIVVSNLFAETAMQMTNLNQTPLSLLPSCVFISRFKLCPDPNSSLSQTVCYILPEFSNSFKEVTYSSIIVLQEKRNNRIELVFRGNIYSIGDDVKGIVWSFLKVFFYQIVIDSCCLISCDVSHRTKETKVFFQSSLNAS